MTKIRSGIDLVKVSRLAKTYENFGFRFLNRIYDSLEIEQFNKRSSRAKPFYLAKNFAGKEAVSKVLGYGFTNGCLLYTSPSPRDKRQSRMPSSA